MNDKRYLREISITDDRESRELAMSLTKNPGSRDCEKIICERPGKLKRNT